MTCSACGCSSVQSSRLPFDQLLRRSTRPCRASGSSRTSEHPNSHAGAARTIQMRTIRLAGGPAIGQMRNTQSSCRGARLGGETAGGRADETAGQAKPTQVAKRPQCACTRRAGRGRNPNLGRRLATLRLPVDGMKSHIGSVRRRGVRPRPPFAAESRRMGSGIRPKFGDGKPS